MIRKLGMRETMIQISGMPFQQDDKWPTGSIEKIIIQRMHDASTVYSYQSINELMFELKVRKNIIESARVMDQGVAEFEIFEKTRANPQYWNVTDIGGIQLKHGVKPSEAIQDIFKNSSLYAFECATAIMIIYYHALLNSMEEQVFNRVFQNLYLYSWHADPSLEIQTIKTNYFLPGDVVYFNNPDFDPETYWWRGENTVVLEDGTYFGHGIGILDADQMIQTLNKTRKPGSNQSAYLENRVTTPVFKSLEKLSTLSRGYWTYNIQHVVLHHDKNSISFDRYLYYLNKMYKQMNYFNPFS